MRVKCMQFAFTCSSAYLLGAVLLVLPMEVYPWSYKEQ